MTTKKASLNFATHINAMSTPALIWQVVQILVSWGGFLYFTFTDNAPWQVFSGVTYLALAVGNVGRELAYRDNNRARPIFGDINVTRSAK